MIATANSFLRVSVKAPKEVSRGKSFQIQVRVQNQGSNDIDTVKVWLGAKRSSPESEKLLKYWVGEGRQISTTAQIERNKTKEINFENLEVPPATLSQGELYEYQVFVSSVDDLKTPPIFRPGKFQVITSAAEGDRQSNFEVLESMSLEYPLELDVNPQTRRAENRVKIRVENVLQEVENFTLTLDFYNREFYEIEYPEGGKSLRLVSKEFGFVYLVLKLPRGYSSDLLNSPTLRLFSQVEQREVCSQILYFKVKPFYGVEGQTVPLTLTSSRLRLPRRNQELNGDQQLIQTAKEQIPAWDVFKLFRKPQDWGCFNLSIKNYGNMRRYFILCVDFDPEFSCEHRVYENGVEITNQIIELSPEDSKELQFWVNPKVKIPFGSIRPRWKEREYQLFLWLENSKEKSRLAAQDYLSSEPESATIVLKPTPSGLLFLLVALLVLGAGALALWLAWRMWRLSPPPRLESFEFSEGSPDGDEGGSVLGNNALNGNGNGQNGRFLTWRVENAEQLHGFRLLSQDTLGQQEQQRFRLPQSPAQGSAQERFEPIVMNGLVCQPLLREAGESQALDCRYDLLGLDVTRDYSFRLEVFPKADESLFGVRKRESQEPVAVAETQTLTFDAPAIEALRLEYQFTETEDRVGLTWDLSYGQEVALVTVTILDEQGQTTVYRYSHENGNFGGEDEGTRLVCDERRGQMGDSFIRPHAGAENGAAAEPSWLSCRWSLESLLDSGLYRFQVAVFTEQNLREAVDERETQETVSLSDPRLRSFRTMDTTYEVGEPVRVSWAIDHPQRLDRLELTLQDEEGQHLGEVPLGLFPHTPEAMLQDENCRTEEMGGVLQLLCEGVELVELPIGRYLFEAGLLLRNGGEEPMRRQSRRVTVEPLRLAAEGGRPGRDSLFDEDRFQLRINGKLVEESPQVFRFALAEGGTPRELEIAWQVLAGGRDVTVELLPIPGEDVGLSGAFRYPLRDATQDLRLMLRVTNELGEEATRVAVIQTYRSQGQTGRSGETPGVRPGRETERVRPSQPLQVPPQVD
ncbi:hypothetical protein [Sodalinema gerasimenkoae]|uniref:hypothetical protein n=1 Tax=Sodalinema gerasimenkoae TaxID=2862348 RepID=UPI0013598266|nr:hypothetical protein [Sodalinema gerasimenkoae]